MEDVVEPEVRLDRRAVDAVMDGRKTFTRITAEEGEALLAKLRGQ